MRLVLIVNPRSGSAPSPGRLLQLLGGDGAQITCVALDALAGDDGGGLRDAALDALRASGPPDRLVVAGGDGSIGVAALCAALLGVPVAVVAAGTANDFARAKGLPLELEDACALARAPRAALRRAELGLAGSRPFVNAAAAGLSVSAARAARPHKRRLGPLAYVVGAIRAGASSPTLACTVACDGHDRFRGRAWQVVVGVTGAFGGGSEIGATNAGDGLLDVAVVPAGSRLGLVRRAYGMRAGRLTAQDGVAHERGGVVDVRIDGAAAFNVDGELRRCEPARFALLPGGFEVVTG